MLCTALLIIWVMSASLMLSFMLKEKVYLLRGKLTHFEHWCGMIILLTFSPLVHIANLISYIRGEHDLHRGR